MASTSILLEAESLVNGDRHNAYGHPRDNWQITADMVSAMLQNKLKAPLTAEDMILVMCQIKISRELYKPKRDNRVDLAGYAKVLDLAAENNT